MAARQHHYIPQFYLKGFAVARKKSHQLIVFDRKSRKTFSAATKNVAVERDFNRVEIEGHPPDAIEKVMSQFETEAAAALERIVAANTADGRPLIPTQSDRIVGGSKSSSSRKVARLRGTDHEADHVAGHCHAGKVGVADGAS